MSGNEILVRRIVSEINAELSNIQRLLNEYSEFLSQYKLVNKYLLRAKASYLTDFYMGIERIFQIIATEIDGGIPRGEEWHKRLLLNMTLEIEGVRPAVISPGLCNSLKPFLGFRHVVRQAYGFQLEEAKLEDLAAQLEKTSKGLSSEIANFCETLKRQVSGEPSK
ncbi:MAG: hypothetical protein IT393_00645 [Nitrospirae bacterium]|nr:hypothetical protein [Nitrospirota bacterium]